MRRCAAPSATPSRCREAVATPVSTSRTAPHVRVNGGSRLRKTRVSTHNALTSAGTETVSGLRHSPPSLRHEASGRRCGSEVVDRVLACGGASRSAPGPSFRSRGRFRARAVAVPSRGQLRPAPAAVAVDGAIAELYACRAARSTPASAMSPRPKSSGTSKLGEHWKYHIGFSRRDAAAHTISALCGSRVAYPVAGSVAALLRSLAGLLLGTPQRRHVPT